MKNILSLLAGLVLLTLLALTLPTQKAQQLTRQSAEVVIADESLPTQTLLKEQTVAWYQYFDLKPITAGVTTQPQNALVIIAEAKSTQKGFKAFRLYNFSQQTQRLTTQNGSLIMIQEAKNQEGTWQPIEYWDYDWGLGSDFGELVLPPQHSVLFTVPLFEGDFETTLRLKLKANKGTTAELLYSEEFSANINIGQFRKPEKQKESISYLK